MDLRERLADDANWRLREVVQLALEEPNAVLRGWDAAPPPGGYCGLAGGSTLYLLSGTARVGAVEYPWRVVLKVLSPVSGRDNPTRVHDWKREMLLYRSGLLEALPVGVRAPLCYGCDEQEDGSVWIWLEHVREDGERMWPTARWALAARHLGQLNGAYLAGRPLPHAPWLGGQRLRTWLERHGELVARI